MVYTSISSTGVADLKKGCREGCGGRGVWWGWGALTDGWGICGTLLQEGPRDQFNQQSTVKTKLFKYMPVIF